MNKLLSKIVSAVTAAVMTLFVSSSSLQTFVNEIDAHAAETDVVLGDVNGDERVDVFDLTLIKREIINPGTISINLTAADVNADGVVDVKDAIEVQDFLLCCTKGFTGSVKKTFSEIDRTIVSKNVNGEAVFGDETQMTNDMAALADTLSSPAEVFKYILNNFKTEFYYGSRKGAVGTYEECGGNDYDQASLMIAMLRYLGYTANYAVGEVVFTDEDLINMTAASDIESAKKIFTAHGKPLEPYESGGYLTEQAMVLLVLDEETEVFLDPSFKYYTKKADATDLDSIMSTLDTQYNLSDSTLDLYAVSNKIESDYKSGDLFTTFQQYEIVQQDIDNTLSYDVPSGQVAIYETSLPNAKSDMVAFTLGGTKIYQKKSCFLYGKDITLEYEFTETAAELMYDGYGYDSIDDLTGNLGPYMEWAQIHGVLKVDGAAVAYNEGSDILGAKEVLQIDITTAGVTTTFEKETTFGALYSIVFDYQIISPYEIADGYNSLPQTVAEQSKLNESNIYGSRAMMNTLTLLGKTYFSQVDTNNAILANFSDMRYERGLSLAIVDFTPDIYMQAGWPRLNKQGKIGIDVLGNWTLFNSLNGDSEEEAKIRHSSGYLSSFYESESIKQFTGMQTVSTAEVLDKAMEQDVDILYLSKANIGDLEASSLSAQNKADITKLINEGNYITVPNAEITIGSWSGTGYIVYDPSTGTNTYIINNNLNGGSLCSWVGLAFFCDIIASVVECTWAFDLVMLGATVLGAGLIMLTGGLAFIPLAVTAIGFGMIVGGVFFIKNIGDCLYESTELMNMYLDGNQNAGKAMKTKGYLHFGLTLGVTGAAKLAKPASTKFAKTKLGQGFLNLKPIVVIRELGYNVMSYCGRYLMNGFANSKYGIIGALDLLNELSPKYAAMLCDFLLEYGTTGAELLGEDMQISGSKAVEETLDYYENGIATGRTKPSMPEGSVPSGSYAVESSAGLSGQNRAARKLANAGYRVEMLSEIDGGNGYGLNPLKNPDFLVEGRVFDCYTPGPGTNIESTLCKELNKKTKEQAERIVLNLDLMTAEEIEIIKETILRKTGVNGTLRRLKELIVILPDGTPGGIIDCWFLR